MALLFALSSVDITLNLSRCFSKLYIRTTNMSVSGVTTVIERLSLINGLSMVYFLLELMYTEHHSVVSFFVGSAISNSFLCFINGNNRALVRVICKASRYIQRLFGLLMCYAILDKKF